MSDQYSNDDTKGLMVRRVEAVQLAMERQGLKVDEFIEAFDRIIDEDWVPENGARVVAKAWTDPAFKQRLLNDGRAAAAELGIGMPAHHRRVVVLENSATLHNVIVCTLCSCTAISLIGLQPDWYKDLEYRARVVRESRTVLKEMGLDLPQSINIKVWDTTTDTRYMVLPFQPPETLGWPEDRLRAIVSRDSLIGVARLEKEFSDGRLS